MAKFNKKKYHLKKLAISDKIGKLKFYINKLLETNSLIPSNITNSAIDELIRKAEETTVEVATIYDYCTQSKIN